jgi:hypothetical protein
MGYRISTGPVNVFSFWARKKEDEFLFLKLKLYAKPQEV